VLDQFGIRHNICRRWGAEDSNSSDGDY
jgi:hypothetical protein